jgi:hypothetical protein
MTHNKGVSGVVSTWAVLPLTLSDMLLMRESFERVVVRIERYF